MRLDYFLIWSNGLKHKYEIFSIIRSTFEIKTIRRVSVGDIKRFVRKLYQCDTVPFNHLVAKTRYLLKLKPEIGFDYAGTNGCTFVMRCRRRPGAAGSGNWDAWKFKHDGASQIFLGIGDWDGATYHNALCFAPSGGTVRYVGEDNPGVEDWHVWRIAYYNDGGHTHITVYVDGAPTPVHSSTLDGDTTSGGLIQTVAQTSQTGEYDIDWVLITDDGDFGPDDPLGPDLPAGFSEEPPPPATGVDHWQLMGR